MALWNRALALLDRISTPRIVDAHCDIPCGIYDPRTAQIAAQTVATLTQKMVDLPDPGANGDATARDAYANTMSRYIVVKEEHAEKVKHEVQILWSDYFKPPHLEKYPNLHDHCWNTLKQASTTKQTVDLEAAKKLQDMVDVVAGWFWESKGASDVERRVMEGRPLV
ncbi:MAG: superoxide dismutase, Ni [Dehalococcoidia bacterium]